MRWIIFACLLLFVGCAGAVGTLMDEASALPVGEMIVKQTVGAFENRDVQPITTPAVTPESFQRCVPVVTSAPVPAISAAARWVLVDGSRFESKYDEAAVNRTVNLQVASKVVDAAVIEAGAVFSFNEMIGLCTEEKGYKPAKIFLKGEKVEGLGGGICQLSSAIFNTAELGGMEIVERHAHSMPVHYVPEGRDAATAYGGVDLKFKNVLNAPVRLRAEMKDGVLLVYLEKKML